jgi:transcriptional regulator with XRE-family HTH domain
MRPRVQASSPTPGAVLTKATLRAARLLGLSDAELAEILGVSPASVSRLQAGTREIPPTGTEGQLAVLFLRMFRSLDALLGDAESCRRWLHAGNAHLSGVPADAIRTIRGLVHVTEYLDAMRGKL